MEGEKAGLSSSSVTNKKSASVTRPASSVVARPKKKPSESSPPDVSTQSRSRNVAIAAASEPTYYLGGGNGNAVIENVMNDLGWKRVKDKTDESVKLRWCEVKGGINYNAFKEGEQMVNRIPNGNLLTNKLGLLNSLQDYSRVSATFQKRTIKLDFLPETYRLDDPKDREAFVGVFKEDEIWICKPTGRNQGKGIFLVRTLDDLQQAVAETDQINAQNQQLGRPMKPLNRIIQRYIMNPLLLDGRKFDIRCYMLIASTVPLLVLYSQGYIRLTMYEYDNSCENIIAHLTNQFIQKRDPKYAELKEETAWSMERFNEYVNKHIAPHKRLPRDWVFGQLQSSIKQIMVHCINAVKHKLTARVGYFDMFGFDFMVDEDMKVWLIEANVNPCLATNCEALRNAVPGVVRETINIAIECFEKARKNRPLLPLKAQKKFEIIYDGSSKSGGGGGGSASGRKAETTSPSRSPAASGRNSQAKPQSPVRRVRSLSPVKETSTRGPSTRDATRGGKASGSGPLTTSPKIVSLTLDQPLTSLKNTKSCQAGDVDGGDDDGGDVDDGESDDIVVNMGTQTDVEGDSPSPPLNSYSTAAVGSKLNKKSKSETTTYETSSKSSSVTLESMTVTNSTSRTKNLSESKGGKLSSSSVKSVSLKMSTTTGRQQSTRKNKRPSTDVVAGLEDEDSKPNRGS